MELRPSPRGGHAHARGWDEGRKAGRVGPGSSPGEEKSWSSCRDTRRVKRCRHVAGTRGRARGGRGGAACGTPGRGTGQRRGGWGAGPAFRQPPAPWGEMIWLDPGHQGRLGGGQGGGQRRGVSELRAPHGRALQPGPGAQAPAGQLQKPGCQDPREWGLSPRAMSQGLPRAGESHTCSPPAAGATAWNQCPCPPTTQPSCPWHLPSVLQSPARP